MPGEIELLPYGKMRRAIGYDGAGVAVRGMLAPYARMTTSRRRVMASPPTVTSGASASLASPRVIALGSNGQGGSGIALTALPHPAISDKVSWTRGAPFATSASEVAFKNNTLSAGTQAGAGGFSFMLDDSDFELIFTGNGGFITVKIDDEYVSLTPITLAASGVSYHRFPLGSRARRRIDVRGFNIVVRGININQTGSLSPAPIRGPRVGILGDSYTFGQGAGGWGANNWCAVLQDYMGWDDVWPMGVGSTGLLANNAGTAFKYRDRIASDIAPWGSSFDIIMVQGSPNDASAGFTTAQIAAEAPLLYADLKAAAPLAQLFHVPTAFRGANHMSALQLGHKAALKAAAATAVVTFLDILELPLSGSFVPSGTLRGAQAAGSGTGGWNAYGVPQKEGIIEIMDADPLKVERWHVKDTGTNGTDGGGAYYFVTGDAGGFQYAHAAGTPWRQVGASHLTGKGYVGATSGFGNCDVLVGADGAHPTDAGHWALGEIVAERLAATL